MWLFKKYMKSKSILFIISVLLLFTAAISCKSNIENENIITSKEKTYYWSNGKKKYLFEVKGSYVVQLDTTIAYEQALTNLQSNSYFRYITSLNTDRYIEIVKSELLASKVKNQKEIINVLAAYSPNKDKMNVLTIMYPDATILLKPKSEISINTILSLIDNNARVLSKNSYNTYVLEVKQWDKLFDYANKIYESEKVEYCHPNFTNNLLPF